jgi:hypothetical protein
MNILKGFACLTATAACFWGCTSMDRAHTALSNELPPEADPVKVGRKVIAQFMSTEPDKYQAKGFNSPYPYGQGINVSYSVASIWLNALRYSSLIGDKSLEGELVKMLEPYYPGGAKENRVLKDQQVQVTLPSVVLT